MSKSLLALILSVAVAATALASDPPQAPSELAKSKSKKSPPVTFVLVERSDLRLLFCTYDVLQARQQRKVCVVDDISKGAKEIPVSPGETVRDVLKKLGKEKARAQLRLVTENAIEQSPLSLPTDREEFLSRPVRPGDILIFAAQT
jgi:16S rRNA C1402 (ribose-2'-O) methylase RsmI